MDELSKSINQLVKIREDLETAKRDLAEFQDQNASVLDEMSGLEKIVKDTRAAAREIEDLIRSKGESQLAWGNAVPDVLEIGPKTDIYVNEPEAVKWAIDHNHLSLLRLNQDLFKKLFMHSPELFECRPRLTGADIAIQNDAGRALMVQVHEKRRIIIPKNLESVAEEAEEVTETE